MKKIIFLIATVLGYQTAVAQQIAPFNQYTEYPVIYNPSFLGADSTSNVLMLYRNQWSGVAGAPQHGLLYINTRLNERTGLGGYLLHESANILGSTGVYITVSHRVDLSEDHSIAFGLSGGVLQKRVLFDRLVAQNPDDPALLESSQSQTQADGSFGIRYAFKDRLDIHIASQQIFGGDFVFTDQSLEKSSGFELLRHFYLGGMYHFPKGKLPVDLSLIGTLRSVQSLQTQWDLGVRVGWQDILSATVLYRDDYGLGTFFTVRVFESLVFGYAYEIPTNGIGLSQSQGTHEISLKVSL